MSDLHSSIRKSSIWMVARLGISLTVGAFITTFIIRSLSIEDYGVYTVLYSLIGYVSIIGSFGVPAVFQRFIPEALQLKDYSLLKSLIFRGLVLRVLLSCATVALILLIHGPIGRLLKLEGFIDYFSVFAFGIILSLEASLMTSVLHSLFLHKYSVIASTIHSIFRGISVFVLLKMGWGIYGVLWAEVASWGLWIALQLVFYYMKFARLYPTTQKTQLPLKRYFRYGGYSALNEVSGAPMSVSTDFFIITAFLGPSAVALYAFADRVIRLFVNCMPHIVLVDVIRPTFFTKFAESGNKQHLADMFNLLLKIGAFCLFPLAAGMFVLGDKMIALVFKPDYLSAQPILLVLVVFTAINVFANPASLVLQAVEQVQIHLYSKIFALYNLVAALIVIKWYGVMGVVLATCSAKVMKNMFLYFYARRYCPLHVDWRGLGIISLNATIMALVVWSLRPFINNIVSLVFVAMFGVFVFLLCSWLIKGFSPQERVWINRIAPRPLFVF